MRRVTLDAPAKVNLHLGIYEGRDARGYHRADSLMVALDVCDRVEVTERDDGNGPHVTCLPPVDVAEDKNTAYRAAKALGELVGRVPSVDIVLYKQVPDQAGLGGSSSDAAAVLKALCELWEVDTCDERVVQAAQSVGADVPFFLDPVPTLLVGAGDVVREKFAPFAEPVSVVLVRPKGPGVSTPVAYAAFDRAPSVPADVEPLCALLRAGGADARSVGELLFNNLDPVACELMPADADVREWLLTQDGVVGGQVSGSGSCVFALVADDVCAERVAAAAHNKFGAWTKAAHIG